MTTRPTIETKDTTVRISLPERFTFSGHREFRAGYTTGASPAPAYEVDFGQTRFIDSAGLGMLLQLSERVGSDPQRLHLTHCTPEMRAILTVAGFGRVATIG